MRVERWWYSVRLWLRSVLRREQVEAELDEELRYHIERQIEVHVARGMSPEAARRATLLALGGVDRRKEESRDTRRLSLLENLLRDLVYGWRVLRRTPAFVATALLTIALGIGATTAVFSLVYGVVLRPLPFPEPDRLVTVWTTLPKEGVQRGLVSPANARDWREQNRVFEDLALVRPTSIFNLTGVGEPERLQGALLSANLLSTLRVAPLLGRPFTEEEDEVGQERVALLSYGLWQRRFGADRTIVGRNITLNNVRFIVVGVMPKDFNYPTRDIQVWSPLSIHPQFYITRTNPVFVTVARLRKGVTLEQAQADVEAISARVALQYPASNADMSAQVAPLLKDTVQSVRTSLYVLLAAVCALLLIGCASLANLLLARALARERELAVRAALGASRPRLVAQSITELVPILLPGGALGLFTARWILDVFVPLLPSDLPRLENVAIHFPVMVFAAVTLAIVALLVTVWPALGAASAGLATTMSELSRRTTGGVRQMRVRDGLVVTQIGLTLLLLVSAALLMKSFIGVARTDPGFRTDNVLTAHMLIPRPRYQTNPEIAQVAQRMLERVQALPTVISAGLINRLPLAGQDLEGEIEFERGTDGQIHLENAELRSITPDYFRTLQIPLLNGRSFTNGDNRNAPAVGIIDDELAQRLWPGGALGRRFRVAGANRSGLGGPNPWVTVVGVVRHVKHARLEEASPAQVYWSYPQSPQTSVALVVRSSGSINALTSAIPRAIREIDSDQPLYDVRTMEAVVERTLARRWLQTVLLGTFAVLALLLAAIGVYGVIAYAVGQRLREFGIRMALGARPSDIIAMVLARGGRLLVLGALLGLVGAAASVRALRTLLHGVQPFDPTSFALATLILALVGTAACILPARRAARTSPNQALRSE